MKAVLTVTCDGCQAYLGRVAYDTADMPEHTKKLLDYLVLNHREDCRYYRTTNRLSEPELKSS